MSIQDEIKKRAENVSRTRDLNKKIWEKFAKEWNKVEVDGMAFRANHKLHALSHEGWRNSISIRYWPEHNCLELCHNACHEFGYETNSRDGWSYRVTMSEGTINILNEKMLQWAARMLVTEYEGAP